MGKQRTTQKRRPIQQAKVNSSTNDVKGRAPAFQEVSLLKHIIESTKRKAYSIPRHAFLQRMKKDEMKYPHPDLFFPGECKFRDTFRRWNPLAKKLPPLSQLLKRSLNSFDSTYPSKPTGGSPIMSKEEERFASFTTSVEAKRGDKGKNVIFDRHILDEIATRGLDSDEDLDVVGDTLAVPFHRRASMTDRDRAFRRDSLSTSRRSSWGSAFSRQNSLRSLNSSHRSGDSVTSCQDSVESSEYRNSAHPLNKFSHRYRSESIGGYSHASHTSFDQSVASRQILFAATAGVPTIRDLYSLPPGDNRHWSERLHSAGEPRDVLDETEDREYEEQSSSQSDSTASTAAQGRIVDPRAAIPGIRNPSLVQMLRRKHEDELHVGEHGEDGEYDEGDSASSSSYTSRSSWTSLSYSMNNDQRRRESLSTDSYVSDHMLPPQDSDSDAGHHTDQSDKNLAVSTNDKSSVDLSHPDLTSTVEGGLQTFSNPNMSTPSVKETDFQLENLEDAKLSQQSSNNIEVNTSADFVSDKLLQGDLVVTGLHPLAKSSDHHSLRPLDGPVNQEVVHNPKLSTRPITTSPPSKPERSASFRHKIESQEKSQLRRGEAQLPSWWVELVPHVKVEEMSSDTGGVDMTAKELSTKSENHFNSTIPATVDSTSQIGEQPSVQSVDVMMELGCSPSQKPYSIETGTPEGSTSTNGPLMRGTKEPDERLVVVGVPSEISAKRSVIKSKSVGIAIEAPHPDTNELHRSDDHEISIEDVALSRSDINGAASSSAHTMLGEDGENKEGNSITNRGQNNTVTAECEDTESERSRKAQRGEEIFAMIVDPTNTAYRLSNDQGDHAERRSLFSVSGSKYSFFTQGETDLPMAVHQGEFDVEQFQTPDNQFHKPEGLSDDTHPPFCESPPGCYDDLEARWNNGDECDGQNPEMNATEPSQVGVIPSQQMSMVPTQPREACPVNASSHGELGFPPDEGPPNDSLQPGASRWIIKSADWKGVPGRMKATQEGKSSRRLFGHRINLGLDDEVREAYALKHAKSHSLQKETNAVASKVGVHSQGTRGKGRGGFLARTKSDSAKSTTPWHRGFLFWKNHAKENFGGKMWNSSEHDSVSCHSQAASVNDIKIHASSKVWRHDSCDDKPKRRHSWSASSAADSSVESNSSDEDELTRRKRHRRRNSRSSRSSNDSHYSMSINVLLQHEGVSIDLLRASPDEAQISTEIGADIDGKMMILQRASENCKDERLEILTPQDHTDGCEGLNKLHGSELLLSIVDGSVAYDKDDPDVFKELEIVARSFEAARLNLIKGHQDQDCGDLLPDLIDFEINLHRDVEVVPPYAKMNAEQYVESTAETPLDKKQDVNIDASSITIVPTMNVVQEAEFSSVGDTTVPLKALSDGPTRRGERLRSNSSDTLDSWVPPVKFSERRKQRELCKPAPEKVSIWRNMLSKSQYVSSRARKTQDQIQAPVPTAALSEMRVSQEALHRSQSRQSLEKSLGVNSPTDMQEIGQLQDNMNQTAQLSGKVEAINGDFVGEKNQDLAVPAEAPADEMKNCDVGGDDADADSSVVDNPEKIQEVTPSLGEACEDTNYYQQPEFSFENVETSFLDDDSTVVSYLEDDEDSQGDKFSALTLFLGDVIV